MTDDMHDRDWMDNVLARPEMRERAKEALADWWHERHRPRARESDQDTRAHRFDQSQEIQASITRMLIANGVDHPVRVARDVMALLRLIFKDNPDWIWSLKSDD
jgi:hypothetical protein